MAAQNTEYRMKIPDFRRGAHLQKLDVAFCENVRDRLDVRRPSVYHADAYVRKSLWPSATPSRGHGLGKPGGCAPVFRRLIAAHCACLQNACADLGTMLTTGPGAPYALPQVASIWSICHQSTACKPFHNNSLRRPSLHANHTLRVVQRLCIPRYCVCDTRSRACGWEVGDEPVLRKDIANGKRQIDRTARAVATPDRPTTLPSLNALEKTLSPRHSPKPLWGR